MSSSAPATAATSSPPALAAAAAPLTSASDGSTRPHKDGFFYSAGPALLSGASQAILFNPIDRALYLRVKFRRRRFLDKRNFERPFQGFMNAVVYRTLVGASYMFWQDSVRIAIERVAPVRCQADVSPQLNSMLIGLAAGSLNGFALNTLQAVKFRMWNTDERGITFLRTAVHMYGEGGVAIFFRGCVTTMVRDSVFGVVYETARRASAWKRFFDRQVSFMYALVNSSMAGTSPSLAAAEGADGGQRVAACAIRGDATLGFSRETGSSAAGASAGAVPAPTLDNVLTHHEATAVHAGTIVLSQAPKCGLCAFVSNLVAAVLASILSSPFNYVRSIVYGTPAGAIPLGYIPLLKSFYTQFFYTYRHGRSYTDRHGMPELGDTEHGSRSAARTATTSASTASAASASGSSAPPGSSAKPAPSSVARRWYMGVNSRGRSSLSARVATSARAWADAHRHHPIAAWTWANSRLNIGWGSLRVGVGMAMGQSLFYIAQDFVRRDAR